MEANPETQIILLLSPFYSLSLSPKVAYSVSQRGKNEPPGSPSGGAKWTDSPSTYPLDLDQHCILTEAAFLLPPGCTQALMALAGVPIPRRRGIPSSAYFGSGTPHPLG